jgi:hypothetical protein
MTSHEVTWPEAPLGVSIKGIGRAYNWLKCLAVFLHLKPTAGCQISTLILDFLLMEGGLYKYPMKNILRTAKFLTTCRLLRMGYWKWRHRKRPWPEMTSHEVTWPEATSCSAYSRAFFLTIVVVQNVPLRMTVSSMATGCDVSESDESSSPLGVSIKGIGRAYNWLKCLAVFLHLKPTAGCQISTLIFDFLFMEGGLPLIETPSGQQLCRP